MIMLGSGCKKNNDNNTTTKNYTVPTTYTFANFSDSNQLKILAMADQLVAKINTANANGGVAVSTQTLTGMFNNTGGYFNDSALHLNTSGLRLADYFPPTEKADILNYFDSIGVFSQSTTTASAGVQLGYHPVSASPNKLYLLSPNGVFYSQVVKKAIMGMCAYQITNVYLSDSINSTTDTTTLERYWDAAFGLSLAYRQPFPRSLRVCAILVLIPTR